MFDFDLNFLIGLGYGLYAENNTSYYCRAIHCGYHVAVPRLYGEGSRLPWVVRQGSVHPGYACPDSGVSCRKYFVFFFNDTATTEIYTLSLHDALPARR